jgi:RNA polymerase sigma-70 factor, ECF subfamily
LPWVQPLPTAAAGAADPAAVVALRDSTRLALIAALQALPARQRAVLLLVEVVGYGVPEAADFLGLSYAATRSLLQRARSTLKRLAPSPDRPAAVDPADDEILQRYIAAFNAADTVALAALLREDVEYEMPPVALWYRGVPAIVHHHERLVWTRPRRALATSANGYPAVATYSSPGGGELALHGIQVLEIDRGAISRVTVFLGDELGDTFGLPAVVDPVAPVLPT